MRKFWLTMSALMCFGMVMVTGEGIDPMSLGLGLGFLIAPAAAANAYEHKYKSVKQENKDEDV